MRTAKIVFRLLFVVAWIMSIAGYLYADIRVEPVVTEIVVPSRGVTEGVFTVTNSGAEPVRVIVEWGMDSRLRGNDRTAGNDRVDEDWLTITPEEFEIGPGGAREIEYAIGPPRGCEGELSAVVFFVADKEIASAAFGDLAMTEKPQKFGVEIFAAIKDTIVLACNINEIDIKRREAENDYIFIVNLENAGNVHLRPSGNIFITGEDEAEYEVKIEKGFPLYPAAKLSYAIRWRKKNLPRGEYRAVVRLDYGDMYGEVKMVEEEMEFVVE